MHVTTALARRPADLDEIAAPLRWPVDRDRVIGAATSLCAGSPVGTPLWREPGVFDLLPATAVSLPR
ncbi:hypothetical protein GTR02_00120 [Kineococcus sp. R8]|uniref:hypothetical protein n=1 Tax=Kineococcus siccus TaxID=2696567 RepID=UPI0014134A4A|nr:hypothetical protein [Kineococcus siccus]NAZ80227.1 hypothetical protein [Kineococcus siccus]